MRWFLLFLTVAVGATPLSACEPRGASAAECRQILERLVTLELHKRGFDDPALAARRQAELTDRYRHELDTCVGRPLPDGAMGCVAAASTAEAVSQSCLR